jgi:hypothetical protein
MHPPSSFLLWLVDWLYRFELDGRASKMREKELKLRMMGELDEAGVLMRIDKSGRNLRKLKGVADISLDMGGSMWANALQRNATAAAAMDGWATAAGVCKL